MRIPSSSIIELRFLGRSSSDSRRSHSDYHFDWSTNFFPFFSIIKFSERIIFFVCVEPRSTPNLSDFSDSKWLKNWTSSLQDYPKARRKVLALVWKYCSAPRLRSMVSIDRCIRVTTTSSILISRTAFFCSRGWSSCDHLQSYRWCRSKHHSCGRFTFSVRWKTPNVALLREFECFRVPWFQYPIIYDIRAKPTMIKSPTGSKGKSFRFVSIISSSSLRL